MPTMKTKVRIQDVIIKEDKGMKRLLVLILVLTLLVVTGTLVSVEAKTRLKKSMVTIGNQLTLEHFR